MKDYTADSKFYSGAHPACEHCFIQIARCTLRSWTLIKKNAKMQFRRRGTVLPKLPWNEAAVVIKIFHFQVYKILKHLHSTIYLFWKKNLQFVTLKKNISMVNLIFNAGAAGA
jgi:hypothetical protein